MINELEKDILKVLVSEEEVKARVAEMGEELAKRFQGRSPLFLCVLKGSFVFMADLCRAITVPCEIGFMCAKSYYSGTTSSGVVKITLRFSCSVP